MSTPDAGDPLLQVRAISLRFGGVSALTNVTFEVQPGELFAVIGPNGAGKTSIFNCLNGVYRPQEGSIELEGVEIVGRRPGFTARLGIARTFQNLGLFVNLDVIDNLMLGRHLQMRTGFVSGAVWLGRARREEVANRRRVEEIVQLLDLGPYRRVPVGSLPPPSAPAIDWPRPAFDLRRRVADGNFYLPRVDSVQGGAEEVRF